MNYIDVYEYILERDLIKAEIQKRKEAEDRLHDLELIIKARMHELRSVNILIEIYQNERNEISNYLANFEVGDLGAIEKKIQEIKDHNEKWYKSQR